jgi:mono/diheme cytochrome c family protein
VNSQPLRWFIVIAAGFLAGIVLLLGAILLLQNTMFRPMFYSVASPLNQIWPGQFESNGERIYFTGRSSSNQPVVPDLVGRGRMASAGRLACANCHGPEGRGGRITLMMESFQVPDIRYGTLTATEGGGTSEADHEEHPPYTDETIKEAITLGVDPSGDPLDWPMPTWRMSEGDLEDLLAFLKTLE